MNKILEKRYSFIENDLENYKKNIIFCKSIFLILTILPVIFLIMIGGLSFKFELHPAVIVIVLSLCFSILIGASMFFSSPLFSPLGLLCEISNSKVYIRDLENFKYLLKEIESNKKLEVIETQFNKVVFKNVESHEKYKLSIDCTKENFYKSKNITFNNIKDINTDEKELIDGVFIKRI